MKKEVEKNAKELFKNWINKIPVEDYDNVKNRIINDCYINYGIFRRWKKALQPIPIIYFEKINNIAGFELLKIESNEQI